MNCCNTQTASMCFTVSVSVKGYTLCKMVEESSNDKTFQLFTKQNKLITPQMKQIISITVDYTPEPV